MKYPAGAPPVSQGDNSEKSSTMCDDEDSTSTMISSRINYNNEARSDPLSANASGIATNDPDYNSAETRKRKRECEDAGSATQPVQTILGKRRLLAAEPWDRL